MNFQIHENLTFLLMVGCYR